MLISVISSLYIIKTGFTPCSDPLPSRPCPSCANALVHVQIRDGVGRQLIEIAPVTLALINYLKVAAFYAALLWEMS